MLSLRPPLYLYDISKPHDWIHKLITAPYYYIHRYNNFLLYFSERTRPTSFFLFSSNYKKSFPPCRNRVISHFTRKAVYDENPPFWWFWVFLLIFIKSLKFKYIQLYKKWQKVPKRAIFKNFNISTPHNMLKIRPLACVG